MRVCIVTVAAHGVGGMQNHTRDLARGLVAAGHEVEVIAARHPDGRRSEERDGVRLHYVDAPAMYERLPFQHPGWLRGSYETFMRVHRQRPFDVIHSESTSALELVRKRVPRNVPFTIMHHGIFIGLARECWRRARRGNARTKVREAKKFLWICGLHVQRGECFRFHPYDWIVPSHQQFEETLRGEFLQRSRGHVVPNGIDTTLWSPCPRHGGDRPLLVSGGRMYENKGFDVAIRAMRHIDADLVLTGDGELRPLLERLAVTEGVADRVHFVGSLPLDELAELVASSDAYLFPTLEWEASGLVLLEAMAAGVPVVASLQGATAEAIDRPGENGVLVPPGQVDALADAIRGLLTDAEHARRIGAAGRRRILAEYTLERMVERTVDVYEIATQRRRAERRPAT